MHNNILFLLTLHKIIKHNIKIILMNYNIAHTSQFSLIKIITLTKIESGFHHRKKRYFGKYTLNTTSCILIFRVFDFIFQNKEMIKSMWYIRSFKNKVNIESTATFNKANTYCKLKKYYA